MKPGDLVQLKCGGPLMVVDVAGALGSFQTLWFSANLHLQRASFPPELLQAFDPAPLPPAPASLEEQIAGMSLLDAIKYVQDATGKTLEEAKRFVQDLRK